MGAHFVAGSVAGVVSDAITHPVDTVRANLQHQRGVGPGLRYRSTLHAFRSLLREGGLYRGFSVVALTTVPAHGLYFAGYEWGRSSFLSLFPGHEFAAGMAGGLLADVAGSLVWVPNDVVKQRVQLQADRSSWAAARRVLAEEGVRGFYRGLGASLGTYGPFVSIYFACYEKFKHAFADREAVMTQVACGSAAAMLASGLTNPVDVVKTRVQVGRETAGVVLRRMLREEGVRAFGKGMVARMSWITPSCAIGIVVYEQMKSLMGMEAI